MKHKILLNKTTVLTGAAIALLAVSAAGSTRAALTQTQNMAYSLSASDLSVDLAEMQDTDAGKEYVSVAEDESKLLTNLLGEDEAFLIGKTYEEQTAFSNDGNYDAYVRVIVTRSWMDEDGKDTTLDPSLIHVTMADDNAWILDADASTRERQVYYYRKVVAAEAQDGYIPITSAISVDNQVTQLVTMQDANGNVLNPENSAVTGNVTTIYNYDGKSFDLDIEVDAIQTHNAVDAAKASWGVSLELDDGGSIVGVSHPANSTTVPSGNNE